MSLERVLRYFTIRGKLTRVSSGSRVGISAGIHPGLKAFGVQKIEIDFDSEEVAFIFEGIHIIYLLLIFLLTLYFLYHEEDHAEAESMSSTAPVSNIATADDEDIMLQEFEGETSFLVFLYVPLNFLCFRFPGSRGG